MSPPASQYVPAPFEQIAGAGLHVQAAAPAAPVQVSFAVQAPEALTKRQEPSVEQVARLPPASQNLPATVQAVGLHWQTPVPALQAECALQFVVVCEKKQAPS